MCMRIIWLHVYAFAIHSMIHFRSAFEPGASRLPYYCTSIFVRFWCTWHASLWIPNQKKKKKSGGLLPDHPHGHNHLYSKFTDWVWFLKTYPRVRIFTYSPRTVTRSKCLQTPWGVTFTMEPNHHRRLQDAVGFFFFTMTNKKKPTGTTPRQKVTPTHWPVSTWTPTLLPRTKPARLRTYAPRVCPPFKGFPLLRKLPHHIGSMERQAPRVASVVLNRLHMHSTGVRMARRLGIHEGRQGAWGKKDAGMDFSGGVKHWDKCGKLRTALEWVVSSSSRTARLELTQVLNAGKNWKWFQFGLEGDLWIDLWS